MCGEIRPGRKSKTGGKILKKKLMITAAAGAALTTRIGENQKIETMNEKQTNKSKLEPV